MARTEELYETDSSDVGLVQTKEDIAKRTGRLLWKRFFIVAACVTIGTGIGAFGAMLAGGATAAMAMSMALSAYVGLLIGMPIMAMLTGREDEDLRLTRQIWDGKVSAPEARNWGKYYATNWGKRFAQDHDAPQPPPPFPGQSARKSDGIRDRE